MKKPGDPAVQVALAWFWVCDFCSSLPRSLSLSMATCEHATTGQIQKEIRHLAGRRGPWLVSRTNGQRSCGHEATHRPCTPMHDSTNARSHSGFPFAMALTSLQHLALGRTSYRHPRLAFPSRRHKPSTDVLFVFFCLIAKSVLRDQQTGPQRMTRMPGRPSVDTTSTNYARFAGVCWGSRRGAQSQAPPAIHP